MGMINDIVIADAVRSAVGRGHKGTLATKRPDELAADVIRGLMQRVPQVRGKVEEVVLGCAMPEGELLEIEREAFVSLCGEPKTQERMQYMLMNNKPLRN